MHGPYSLGCTQYFLPPLLSRLIRDATAAVPKVVQPLPAGTINKPWCECIPRTERMEKYLTGRKKKKQLDAWKKTSQESCKRKSKYDEACLAFGFIENVVEEEDRLVVCD